MRFFVQQQYSKTRTPLESGAIIYTLQHLLMVQQKLTIKNTERKSKHLNTTLYWSVLFKNALLITSACLTEDTEKLL